MNPQTTQSLSLQGRLLLVVVAVAMATLVVGMLRRRRLHEEYALVWLGMLAILLVVVVSERVLWMVTHLVGARFPASALTLLGLAVIFLFLILYSTRLSVLSDKVRDLAQELALLRTEADSSIAAMAATAGLEEDQGTDTHPSQPGPS